MLAIVYVAGAASWAKAHWARAHGQAVETIPSRGLLAAFLILVLFQLLPLPPVLLSWLSPGSYAFHAGATGVLDGWRPITVSAPLTARGLGFFVGMALLFATTYREFGDPVWLRRLVFTISFTGAFVTLVGLVQNVSLDPGKIYGLWRPQYDYTVFGPYVNKNHFAGFLVIATPLAFGLAIEAFQRVKATWEGRRVGWLALGDPEGASFLRLCGLTMLLVVGVLVSESRGGVIALAVALVAMSLRRQHRRLSGRMSGASGRLRALGGFGAARKAVPEIRVRQSCRPLGRPGSVDSEFSSVWRRLQRSRADLSKTPGGEYEQLVRPGSQRVPPGHSRYRRAGSTRLLGLLPPAASIRLAHRDLQSPRARFLWGSCRRSHVKPVRFQLADSSERCGVRRCRRSGLAPRPLTLTPSFSPA